MRVISLRNSIIAIHGIGASPDNTWESKKEGVNWLKDPDMLPKVAPQARIMRFGWESQWIGKGYIDQHCSTVAEQLLNDLRAVRRVRNVRLIGSVVDVALQEAPQRPMVFICHCFGGQFRWKSNDDLRQRSLTII